MTLCTCINKIWNDCHQYNWGCTIQSITRQNCRTARLLHIFWKVYVIFIFQVYLATYVNFILLSCTKNGGYQPPKHLRLLFQPSKNYVINVIFLQFWSVVDWMANSQLYLYPWLYLRRVQMLSFLQKRESLLFNLHSQKQKLVKTPSISNATAWRNVRHCDTTIRAWMMRVLRTTELKAPCTFLPLKACTARRSYNHSSLLQWGIPSGSVLIMEIDRQSRIDTKDKRIISNGAIFW